MRCVCSDHRPPPAVWAVCQGAARCGQVTALGGEVHPGKLPRGAGRHTEVTRQTVACQPDVNWAVSWHLICFLTSVADKGGRTAWPPVTSGSQVWFQVCWKRFGTVVVAQGRHWGCYRHHQLNQDHVFGLGGRLPEWCCWDQPFRKHRWKQNNSTSRRTDVSIRKDKSLM